MKEDVKATMASGDKPGALKKLRVMKEKQGELIVLREENPDITDAMIAGEDAVMAEPEE